jgi:hypothetical protein
VKVNGEARYVAQVSGAGFLSAHLNLNDRPKEGRTRAVLRVVGHDTSTPTENVSMQWPETSLTAGDVVHLQVLEDGPADPPASSRRTSEAPTNLFHDANLAKELLSMVEDFERRLFALMEKSAASEPEDEHKKFKLAVGHALADLGDHLLRPVFRRHAELIPEAMRGELL